MLKRQQLPPWLESLYGELIKPPYFLQAQVPGASQSGTTTEKHANPKPEPTASHVTSQHVKYSTDGDKDEAKSSSGHKPTSKSQAQSVSYVPTPVLSRYPFDVQKKEYMNGILKIETEGNARYAIKQAAIPSQRVRFLQRALKHAKQQGFTQYAPFALSKKKSPVVMYDGNLYYATEWIDGQEANFSSTEHVAQVSYSLAQFHESTRGFQSESYAPESAFDVFQLTKQRNRDLHQLIYRAEAKKNRDMFDDVFTSIKEDMFDDAAQSLQRLQQAECEAFLADDQEHPGLCHLDVIPSNCIYVPNRRIYLIDFDLATFAPRALDIAHLLRRSLERSNWNGDMAYAVFLHFHSVKSIPKVEYRLVEALMRFPYQAWRIAHTRYHFFEDDESQLDALQQYVDQNQRRKSFLQSLETQIDGLSTTRSE